MRWLLLFVLAAAPSMVGAQSCDAPMQHRDWSDVDQHATEAQPRHERTVRALANYLRRAGVSDEARTRAAFRWVSDRIRYDTGALSGRRPLQSADSTLARREAVCEGYSRLLVALLSEMGIEAEYLAGWYTPEGEPVTFEAGRAHAWVAARVRRQWILMDPTFGAGWTIEGEFYPQFKPEWFAPPPHEFVRTHLPWKHEWQLLEHPLTQEAAVARETPEASCLREPARPAPEDPSLARAEPQRRDRQRDQGDSSASTGGLRDATPAPLPPPPTRDPSPPWYSHLDVRFRVLDGIDRLDARRRTTVRVEVPEAYAVALFEGALVSTEMRARGDVWSGAIRPSLSTVVVAAKMDRDEPWRQLWRIPVDRGR